MFRFAFHTIFAVIFLMLAGAGFILSLMYSNDLIFLGTCAYLVCGLLFFWQATLAAADFINEIEGGP